MINKDEYMPWRDQTVLDIIGDEDYYDNLGVKDMPIYKPSTELNYEIESDGDQWFCHYSDFTNVVESDEVAFGATPQEALQKFIDSRTKPIITKEGE